ncbi:MAG: hypothetical protein WKF96_15690 [Solirubrobacteraceae bacterium]
MHRVLMVLVVLLVLPATAAAVPPPPTVIDFNGLANNESVTSQYAAQGILFGQARNFGLPNPPGRDCFDPAVGRTGGIAGTSVAMQCRNEAGEIDPLRSFSIAMEFGFERRDVRFDLQERTGVSGVIATVRAYDIGGTLLSERRVTLTGATTQVPVTSTTANIAYINIFGELDVNDATAGDVLLDNLVALNDEQPQPPKFKLALETPTLGVFEGSRGTATVSIRRFNGSTGLVTLSTGALPSGIRSVQFDPNPVSGRNPVAFTIRADNPASGQRQLVVNATGSAEAGTNAGASLVQTVNLLPAVVQFGSGITETVVAGCGPQRFTQRFDVRGELFGGVDLVPTATGGLGVSAEPVSKDVTGAGSYAYDVLVDPRSSSGTNTVTLNARPRDAQPASAEALFTTTALQITGVQSPVQRPRFGRPGEVTVRGRFPATCAVTFVDVLGQTWKELGRSRNGAGDDVLVLELPVNAVPGPLEVRNPAGERITTTPVIDVVEYRNTFASYQANAGPGARVGTFTWEDYQRAYGTDDTEVCLVACVRDPTANAKYNDWKADVKAMPASGLCAGWSIMSMYFKVFPNVQSLGFYAAGVSRAYDVRPVDDGTNFKREVVRWHIAQHDQPFLDETRRSLGRSAADERQILKDTINGQGAAFVTIRQGVAGHAVVAYDYKDIGTPTGPGLEITLYDPNRPYGPDEVASRAARDAALASTTITIQGDGSWNHPGMGWQGPNTTLGVTAKQPQQNAEVPVDITLGKLFAAGDDADAPAAITQIRTGGANVLDPSGAAMAGSPVDLQPRLTGVRAAPEYRFDPGREYELEMRGSAAGSYVPSVSGGGATAKVEGATTAPGQVDKLTVRSGRAQLTWATGGSGGPVSYRLIDPMGKATRTATIATTSRRGAADDAKLGGGALRLRHGGAATTATVTLGSVGEGLPGTVTTAPIRVGTGQSLELKPQKWASLTDGVRLVVRDRRGRVVRRGTVKLRASKVVTLSGVSAKRSGGRVIVKGRIGKRGSAPVLVALVEQLRGGRVVARKAVTRRGAEVKAGSFSLPVAVGAVRNGTRLRAKVTLVDEGADLASATKGVTVR